VVQRQQVLGEGLELHGVIQFIGEQREGQLLLRVELIALECHQLLLHGAVQIELLGAHFGRNRHAQLVVVAAVAVGSGEQQRVKAAARAVELGGDAGQLLLGVSGFGAVAVFGARCGTGR
jgi:ADP-ribosylglycohydrolase